MWGGVGEKNKICEGGSAKFSIPPPPQDLKWNSPNVTLSLGSVHQDLPRGIQGVHMVFNNNCSESCSVTISKSHFTCSSIKFNNLDIRIENSTFKNTFITAQQQPGFSRAGNHVRIQDTEFVHQVLNETQYDTGLIETEPCKQLNFICVNGSWNVFEVLRSTMTGSMKDNNAGIEVVHANVQTLSLLHVQISYLSSAFVIGPGSYIGTFNVTDGIYVANKDGFDIGKGVRYMAVSRTHMNNTGTWYGNEWCSSAIKGNIQTLIIRNSIFGNNHAFRKNCNGVAVKLIAGVNVPLLVSNSSDYEDGNILRPSVEIMSSVFMSNVNENCRLWESAAVAIYGFNILINVHRSAFEKNEVCKGAGLHIDVSKRWPHHNHFAEPTLSSEITGGHYPAYVHVFRGFLVMK